VAGKQKSEMPVGEEGGPDASVQAFRDALEKSVSVSRDRMQEVVDDAVRRGRMTRSDAEELIGRIIGQVREQAEELVGQVEPLLAKSPVAKASREVGSRVRGTARNVRDRADEPLQSADRLRRKAGLPGFPITAYDQLSVPQINNRLLDLDEDDLRKVLAYEISHRNRIGVLRTLERKLTAG
jgi:polyhydroxyalkanoate synthesis regulator phasin